MTETIVADPTNWALVIYATLVCISVLILIFGLFFTNKDLQLKSAQNLLSVIVAQALLYWAGLWSLW